MKVTLLKRGFLVPPPGLSEIKQHEMLTMIPREYIVQSVKRAEVPKGPGDRVFVIKSATGSGKSITLPPSFLYRGKRIALTEPTKLIVEEATYDLARRNPELKFGHNLGYQTGVVNKGVTRGLMVMTPGILLQHILTMAPEQLMRRYSTWMIDEVHRHDLTAEFLLRACKMFIDTHWANPECPVLILMSATINTKIYSDYYETPHIIEVAGQSGAHAIEEHWPEISPSNLITAITDLAVSLKGDTLIFMPTAKSMEAVQKSIEEKSKDSRVIMISSAILEGTSEARSLQIESKEPRIILATNVAEAGVTFEHLVNCIDTGYAFNAAFNPQLGATVSFTGSISRASATQRRGRVGRQRPGNWYPMYTKAVFNAMQAQPYPEVYVSDMSDQILRFAILQSKATPSDDMSSINIESKFDPADLRLIYNPSSEMICHCMERLYLTGMLDTNWQPTIGGWVASRLSNLGVQEVRLILSGIYYGVEMMHVIVIACAITISSGATKLGTASIATSFGLGDGFINLLLTYEAFREKINIAGKGVELSTRFLEEWCNEQEMNYRGWLDLLALIDETVLQVMSCGIPVPNWGSPPRLSDDLDRKDMTEVHMIKQCILESYRMQMAVWNSRSESYVTTSRGQRLKVKNNSTPKPQIIVTNAIEYSNGIYQAGKFISALDGWVIVDRRFLY